MEFTSDFNLVHRATISVISSLWNQADIIADIENLLFGNPVCKSWTDIENNVLSSLTKLRIPKTLNLEKFVQPMGMQVFKWVSLTQYICQAYPQFFKPIVFVWTENGTLNYVETTRLIIECTSHKILAFCLACMFSIEDIILKYWPEVGLTLTKEISSDPFYTRSIYVNFWIYYLNDNVDGFLASTGSCGVTNPNEVGFLVALTEKCPITSLNYFLNKIEPENRQRLILSSIQIIFRDTRRRDGNILLFLFSHLEKSTVIQIINENSYSVLSSLLDWPCQEYFMACADTSWNHLSNIDYLNLFQDIVECISRYHASDVYKNLIESFWHSAPCPFKNYVISKCISGSFLSRLCRFDNTDGIMGMILKSCTRRERIQIIFHFEGMNMCDLLVKREKWNTLEFFIKSCLSTRGGIDKFIEHYASFLPCYSNEERCARTVILFEKLREWYQ